MGTDIHPRIEIKRDGRWFDITDELDTNSSNYSYENFRPWDYLDNRNYVLFSILGDVRSNGSVEPISNKRGIPKNSKIDPNDVYIGDHSFTWVSLKELVDYDWEAGKVTCGIITEKQYKKFRKEQKRPSTWCAVVGGRNIVTVDEFTHGFVEETIPWLMTLVDDPKNLRIVCGFAS